MKTPIVALGALVAALAAAPSLADTSGKKIALCHRNSQ